MEAGSPRAYRKGIRKWGAFARMLLVLLPCGCVFYKTEDSRNIESASNRTGPLTPGILAPVAQAPLTLEVKRATNDGMALHVFARVTAHTDWDSSAVLVRLAGLNQGEVIREVSQSLSRAVLQPDVMVGSEERPEHLAAGKSLDVYLSIAAQGITDYQIELLWGAEAVALAGNSRGLAENIVPPSSRQNVSVENPRVERRKKACAMAPCPVTLNLSVDLVNTGPDVISRVLLAVGFVWVEPGQRVDFSAPKPENEESVEIGPLQLGGGQSQTVRLVFDRPIPGPLGKDLWPVVRVKETSVAGRDGRIPSF